jgi:hypothetical protein
MPGAIEAARSRGLAYLGVSEEWMATGELCEERGIFDAAAIVYRGDWRSCTRSPTIRLG